ncbi:MAG TPA: TIM barrel protein [Methylomirabilota bacterium]|nr:TIM barrel protein [Methylomirabilota bacterium]
MYSLSSCWNSQRHIDGRAMLEEIRALGFEYAELSHGIRISLLPGILDAVDSGLIKISTLHNYCPLPMGIDRPAPNVFQFSSENPRERDNAFKHTVKTIETAARLKAPLVVLHMGSVDMKEYTDKLIGLIEDGKKETPKFQKLHDEVLRKREDKKEEYVNNAYEMLRRLIPEAEKHGVLLGVENREALEEIPFDDELEYFFREFDSPVMRYWHDTGHAQIKANLGFIDHMLHVDALEPRLAGFHIHDVEYPGRDHQQPGTGCVDFAALKKFVRPEHIKVFEFSPKMDAAQAAAGVAHIKSLWGDE